MSHQYGAQRQYQLEYRVIRLVVQLIYLTTILCGVVWICVQLEQARTPCHEKTLRAIADEEEVMMDIIKAVNRYETRVVPELTGRLRLDLIWTEESLLKPLEDRINKRLKLLKEAKQKVK